ncbi:hypothetical protein Droror1_Dr00014134 [Drosera rotundifolia]
MSPNTSLNFNQNTDPNRQMQTDNFESTKRRNHIQTPTTGSFTTPLQTTHSKHPTVPHNTRSRSSVNQTLKELTEGHQAPFYVELENGEGLKRKSGNGEREMRRGQSVCEVI